MIEGAPQSFAAILDDLCLHPVSRRERYTNTELARLVTAAGGAVTEGYVCHLRKGHRDNPTLQTIEDLAAALHVCPAALVGGRRERIGDERPRRTFLDRLRRLFYLVHPPGRGPYTPEKTARAISDDGTYGSISSSYIRDMLNPAPGVLPNPRLKHLLGLAKHFGLTEDDESQVAYFLDDHLAATIDAELDTYTTLRDAGVVEFVTRMTEQLQERSPHVRHQVVDAVLQAVESGDTTNWSFPFRNSDAG